MKKGLIFIILIVIISVTIFLILWLKNNTKSNEIVIDSKYNGIKVGNKVSKFPNEVLYSPSVRIIREEDYSIVYNYVSSSTVEWVAILSKNGEWIYNDGISFVDFDYDKNYEGYTMNDFRKIYGDNFVNIGINHYTPICLTKDGKIAYLDVTSPDSDDLRYVTVTDIHTGETETIYEAVTCNYIDFLPAYMQIQVGTPFQELWCFNNVRANYGNLMIFQYNYGCVIYVSDKDGKVSGYGVISNEGNWIYNENLPLINFDYSIDYDGYTIEQFEEMYKEGIVVDGESVTSHLYITDNGKLLFYQLNDGLIYEQDIVTSKFNDINSVKND